MIYTTPLSVLAIMFKFGSAGFNNTPDGLLYVRDDFSVLFKKGDLVTKEKLGL
jgi:hypothetical protein